MVTLNKNLARFRYNREIKIFSHPQELFEAAANDFALRAVNAVNTKGIFTVALAGGNTPKSFFDILTEKKEIPWRHIKFFLTDERYVPYDNPESNYRMMNEHLFSKVDAQKENIYPIPTAYSNPKEAAQDYTLTLRKVFDISHTELPLFDLIYLGLGEDAHTASLMPFSEVINNALDIDHTKYQLVDSLWVPKLRDYRITLTPCVINHAGCIIFLVTGANKASAVRAVLEGPFEPQGYPAQLIHCIQGKTLWYLAEEAAEKLRRIET